MYSRNKLVIATYATKRYGYALPNFGRRMASAIAECEELGLDIKLLFIGDTSEQIKAQAQQDVFRYMPDWVECIFHPIAISDDDVKNYKEDAQLLIAQMQGEAFALGRKWSADYFFSAESDVLVQPNTIRVAIDCLRFDNGYYDVAMCSYPSQGGGPFLGGRGTQYKHIEEDVHVEERKVPKELSDKREELEKKLKEATEEDEALFKELRDTDEEIKKCEPLGNVYELNAKRWRKRGWMEYAYPAIGKGAIVPTDWVGLGATILSKKALSLAHFDGYEGKGTQDLYLGWNRWVPAGLKMCVTTHSICDHVVRKRDGEEQLWDDFTHIHVFHELEGEYEGHLRQRHGKHYTFEPGEAPKIGDDNESPKDGKPAIKE
jgi:hypothetical protein